MVGCKGLGLLKVVIISFIKFVIEVIVFEWKKLNSMFGVIIGIWICLLCMKCSM